MALYACLLLSLRDIEAMQPSMSSLAARRRGSTGADRRSWKTRNWSSEREDSSLINQSKFIPQTHIAL